MKRYGRTTVDGAKGASLRDFHNYWVSSDRIDGAWTDAVYLNSSGFDPALFHDDDGRSWLLNMLWDHRPDRKRFAGIVIQQMDMATGRLLGERRHIFDGTPLGFTEGPHLYKRDGWYHLLVAEGGTERGHAVTMARARDLFGPYEVHPDGPVLTARDTPDAPLQRTGHGDLVDTPKARRGWPISAAVRCPPATAACWAVRRRSSGWNGARTVGCAVPSRPRWRLMLCQSTRSIVSTALNCPPPSNGCGPRAGHIFSLTERPGHLRLFGRETIGSLFEQALIARRQTAFTYDARALLDYEPEHFQQAAGIVAYYNSTKYHFLQITAGDAGETLIQVLSVLPNGEGQSLMTPAIAAPPARSNCGPWSIMRSCASRSGEGPRRGIGFRSTSTPPSCRTRRRWPGCPISPAPLSVWPVRT